MPVKKLVRDKMTFGLSDSNEDQLWKNTRNIRFNNRKAVLRPRLKQLVQTSLVLPQTGV